MGSHSKESGWEMGEASARAEGRVTARPADQGSRWSAGRDHPHRAPIHREKQGAHGGWTDLKVSKSE